MIATIVAFACLLIYMLWRDRCYHLKLKELASKIDALEAKEQGWQNQSAAVLSTAHQPSIDRAVLFDRQAAILCAVFVFCRLLEASFLHRQHLLRFAELEHIPKQILVKVKIYLLHSFPVVNASVHVLLLSLAALAWLNIDRPRNLAICCKIIVIYGLSLPVSFELWSIYTILCYLPRSVDQLVVKARDKAFWWWVLSKLLAIDDLYRFLQTALNLFYTFVYTLPFLFMFLYKDVSFDSSADVVNVFLANMIAQSSLASLWVNMLIIYTLGSPPISKNKLFIVRIFTSNTSIFLFSLFQILNFLLCILRVLWFVFASWSCKTLITHIMVLFFLVHYACVVYVGLSFFGILVNKDKLTSEEKRNFVEKLANKYEEIIDSTSASTGDSSTGDDTTTNEKERKLVIVNAEETFEEILQSSCVIACFLTDEDLKEYADPSYSPESNDFFVIFKRIFHQTMFRYFSSSITEEK